MYVYIYIYIYIYFFFVSNIAAQDKACRVSVGPGETETTARLLGFHGLLQ